MTPLKKIRAERVTMSENHDEVVNTPEIEARIKIEKLENELKLSKKEIIQCEKEKSVLISVVKKLHEKFLGDRLDDMISKLESNVLLFDKAVENAKRNVCNDNSTSPSVDNESIVDDQLHTEHAYNSVTDLLTKVSEALNNIRNDDLSSSSSDNESNSDSEQSVESETDVRSGDVLDKVAVSLNRLQSWVDQMRSSADNNKRSDPPIKNNSKCDEVFTISDEEDSIQCDFQIVSHSKAPAVIELSDSEDCLLLSGTSDNQNFSKTDKQPQRNNFLGIFKKAPLVDVDLPVQSDIKIDVPRSENSNDVCSETNQNKRKFSDVQKSSTPEFDDLSDEIGETDNLLPSDGLKEEAFSNTSQKGTPFNVLLKSVLPELGDFPSVADETDSSKNNSLNKVPLSKTNQNSQKPAHFKLDTSLIPVDEEDILLRSDESNDVAYSKINLKRRSYGASQNRALVKSDVLLTPLRKEDNLLQNDHSTKTTYRKRNHDKISIPEDEEDIFLQSDDSNNAVYSKIDPKGKSYHVSQNQTFIKSDVSLTPVHKEDNLLKNNLSSESSYQKANRDKTSFSGIFQKTAGADFGDSSTRTSTNAETSRIDKSIEATCSKIKQEIEVRAEFDDSSTQIGAEVNLFQTDNSNDGKLADTNQKEISSVEIFRKSLLTEFCSSSSSSTQSCEVIELFDQTDHPDNTTRSNINHQGQSSLHVLKRSNPFELDSSSTPPIAQDNLLEGDDSNEATHSKVVERTKNFLRLLKRRMPEVEQDMKPDMDARKRAKYDLYGSYCSRSSLLSTFLPPASFEELRRNRLPIWPCPVCEECFGDAFRLSKHLNQRHFGDEGVCSCSICGFVTPSVSAHKRHVNKHHGNAFLVDNRFQLANHLNEEHAYATKRNFT